MSKEWKLVPVELTEAMREAYEANSIAPIGPISKYGYRAMLDAAPVAELPEANLEAAAKKLAACMDYPWEHMPEQGRASMREHAKAVIDAALSVGTEVQS